MFRCQEGGGVELVPAQKPDSGGGGAFSSLLFPSEQSKEEGQGLAGGGYHFFVFPEIPFNRSL